MNNVLIPLFPLLWLFFFPIASLSSEVPLTEEERQWLLEHQTIHVGFSSAFEPLLINEDDEELRGIIPDFFAVLSEKLGITFKISDVKWSTTFHRLKNKDIDIIAQVNRQVAEINGWLTVESPYKNQIWVFGRKDRTFEISSDNDLNNLRVAYFNQIIILHQYFASHPVAELISAESVESSFDLLMQNRVDVVVGHNTSSYVLIKNSISEIEPIYTLQQKTANSVIAIREDYPLLPSILRKTIDNIDLQTKYDILSRWSLLSPEDAKSGHLTVLLDDEEKAYLRQKQRLKLCIDPDWMPFESISDGRHIGITSDYFKLFSRSIKTPIDVVETSSWTQSLDYARKRQCDLMAAVMETPSRRQFLDFTPAYLINPLVLAAAIHTPWIEDLEDLYGRKIGVVTGYSYDEILRRKYPNMELVSVDTLSDGLSKVERGEIYGVVGALASVGYQIQNHHISQVKIAGKFAEQWELGIGCRNDEPQLRSIFNKLVKATPADIKQKIFDNWVVVKLEETPSRTLTEKEKLFLQKHPVIQFYSPATNPPFSFKDNKGKGQGIAIDYLKAIASKIGFDVVFSFSDQTLLELLPINNNTNSIYSSPIYAIKRQDIENFLEFGDVFFSYPLMIYAHKDAIYLTKLKDLRGKNVAVRTGFIAERLIHQDYPTINLLSYDSDLTALQKVDDREADAYIGNLARANYLIAHEGLENIKLAAPTEYAHIEYRFVAPRNNPELVSILEKGMRSLDPETHRDIQQKWFTLQTIKTTDYGPLGYIIALAVFILVWFFWWNRKLVQTKQKTEYALNQLQKTQILLEERNETLKLLATTDPLTGIYNRAKLETVIQNELERSARYHTPFGIIMIDLDHFKNVNDTFGHQTGDMLLKEIANLLKENIRKVDTVGRWGGEEFLIVCPSSTAEGIVKLANFLRKTISDRNFGKIGKKTASFGATLFDQDDTAEKIIARADMALYHSKELGRNRASFKEK